MLRPVRSICGLAGALAVCGCALFSPITERILAPDPVVYQTPEDAWCDEVVSTCYVHAAIDASATRAHFGEPAVAATVARPDDFYLTGEGHLCDRRARACYGSEGPQLPATRDEFSQGAREELANRISQELR